jgi:uncharacterized protein (TIGR04222 family)
VYGIITAMVIVAAMFLRRWLREDGPTDDIRPLEPHEVACLGRGAAGVLQSTLAGLVADGRMQVVEEPSKKLGPISIGSATYTLRATSGSDSAASDVERLMLAMARPMGAKPAEILAAAKPAAEQTVSQLQSRGLLETNDSFGPARWWPIILIIGLMALGALKLAVGLSRGKPVGFLAIWLVALVVVAIIFAVKPHRTLRGDRLLKDLKNKYEKLKSTNFALPGAFSPGDLMLVAGLFGIAAVSHPQVSALQSALRPVAQSDGGLAGSSGGCSDGGGGGGGGCGGGCGGCGGGD